MYSTNTLFGTAAATVMLSSGDTWGATGRLAGRRSDVAHGHRIRDAAHACHVGLQNVESLPSDGVRKSRWTVEAFTARARRRDVLSQALEPGKIGRLERFLNPI